MKIRTYISLLLFIFISPFIAQANDVSGGSIQYEWVSDSTFNVYFKHTRVCYVFSTIYIPDSIALCIHNSCTNQTVQQFMHKVTGNITSNNQPNGYKLHMSCDTLANKCNNPATGLFTGVSEWWYMTTITLPLRCNQWRFSVIAPTRTNNGNITKDNFYTETYLYINNFNDPQYNSSPTFSVPATMAVCRNQPVSYSNGATDKDGDSLVYSIMNPLTNTACTANYSNAVLTTQTPALQFPTNPFQCNNTFSLNAQTGVATFTLSNPLTYSTEVLTFLVKEYKNGQLVGSVMREVQFYNSLCTTPAPTLGVRPGSVTGSSYNNNRLEGCIGKAMQVCFDIKSTSSSGRLKTRDNHISATPGASLSYSNQGTDLVKGCFSWTPSASDIGVKTILFDVVDSTCNSSGPPMLTHNQFSFDIYVAPPVTTDNDMAICINEKVPLSVTGGYGNYTWQISPGGTAGSLSCTSCSTTIASPTSKTTYVVSDKVCTSNTNYTDTVTLNVRSVPPTHPTIKIKAYPGSTVPPGTQLIFSANATNCSNPYFQWIKNGIYIKGATTNSYNTASLKNNDLISCKLNCADTCPQPRTQISDTIRMTITNKVPALEHTGTIKIFPNPNDGSFIVENHGLTLKNAYKLYIINLYGQVMYDAVLSNTKQRISLSDASPGIYFLRLVSGDQATTTRFVIRR